MRYIPQIPMKKIAGKHELILGRNATLPGTASEQFEAWIAETIERRVAKETGKEAPKRKLPLPGQSTFLESETVI